LPLKTEELFEMSQEGITVMKNRICAYLFMWRGSTSAGEKCRII
jgi:hypothetical protein